MIITKFGDDASCQENSDERWTLWYNGIIPMFIQVKVVNGYAEVPVAHFIPKIFRRFRK